MRATHQQFILLPTSDGRFVVHRGTAAKTLSSTDAFELGYRLLRHRRGAEADLVLQMLSRQQPGDSEILLLLARCRAAVRDRDGCAGVLYSVCGPQQRSAAEQIHAAFVFDALGVFPEEAICRLSRVVRRHAGYPVLCLLLGDMCSAQRRTVEAVRHWRLAVKRAQGGGPVARLARRQLARVRDKNDSWHRPSPQREMPRTSPSALLFSNSRSQDHACLGTLCRV